MSSFPPLSWNVRFLQDMENLECSLRGENNITMEAFVAVRPAGGQEGNFKFIIGGPRMLKLSFPVSKLLDDPAFKDMVAEIEMKPGDQIKLCKNSACSAYKKELVAQQANRPGICMRWLLGTHPGSKKVLLIAQVRSYVNNLKFHYKITPYITPTKIIKIPIL